MLRWFALLSTLVCSTKHAADQLPWHRHCPVSTKLTPMAALQLTLTPRIPFYHMDHCALVTVAQGSWHPGLRAASPGLWAMAAWVHGGPMGTQSEDGHQPSLVEHRWTPPEQVPARAQWLGTAGISAFLAVSSVCSLHREPGLEAGPDLQRAAAAWW